MPPFISFPFMLLALVGLFLFVILLFFLVQIGLVTVAFTKLGLTAGQAFLILLATLVGSGVNIPLYRTGKMVQVPQGGHHVFLDRYGQLQARPQEMELKDQIVTVNLGGCIIPTLLSLYFLSNIGFSTGLVIALISVAAVCYAIARPMPGRGIGVPMLIPPIVAAIAAMIFAPEGQSPQVAYIAGCMGILIGADILHLRDPKVLGLLGAPLLSIGGAGTFDGIFVTGIIAVLLA
ncbi:DUF1614 domain-containing protein [Desulfobaculum bizertense]|uniref:Uncharacterized membrane protein n=1 Tax=Desulfobaculum bizertense DSM 18034 TaxID=1121442 RepID=A0A1T4WJ30_9BACT|nr:DUF1614 domain-containing protein [Desulfobaculum bizertense]UIJ37171.1 DUF1614 domain-containing protein [Desulfobaculum bizertense]SKA77197.1 Uncharacterized membrane protein [Desulfobaculum bizertense DSM 18034]